MQEKAKELEDRLRDAIKNCDYGSIEELSRNSGVGIPTIQKFLDGRDILFSDAAQLIATSDGRIVFENEWLDMRKQLLEEIDSYNCLYVSLGENKYPQDEIYFDEIYPNIEIEIANGKTSGAYLLTGITNTSMKKIRNYVGAGKTFEVTVAYDSVFHVKKCHFVEPNIYSKTAELFLEEISDENDGK